VRGSRLGFRYSALKDLDYIDSPDFQALIDLISGKKGDL
jgi:hypothetical protein